jgi:hypothetical protein
MPVQIRPRQQLVNYHPLVFRAVPPAPVAEEARAELARVREAVHFKVRVDGVVPVIIVPEEQVDLTTVLVAREAEAVWVLVIPVLHS